MDENHLATSERNKLANRLIETGFSSAKQYVIVFEEEELFTNYFQLFPEEKKETQLGLNDIKGLYNYLRKHPTKKVKHTYKNVQGEFKEIKIEMVDGDVYLVIPKVEVKNGREN